MTVTKADLADALADHPTISRKEAHYFVECFIDVIQNCLEQGFSVKLSGFGNFVLRNKSTRPGRNPRTGEIIPVAARRVVVFKPGSKMKQFIEENHPELQKEKD